MARKPTTHVKVPLAVRRAPRTRREKNKEPTAIGRLIRAAGSAGGGYLGNMIGMGQLGGAAGHQLGALASRWLGFGDYAVTRNSIVTDASSMIPSMHKTSQSVIVRHKEFIGTVTSTQAFTVQYSINLNPGLPGSFPWLSKIATRYQEYKFLGVVLHYVPASGDAVSSTNPALGTVMMQTSYRASDISPVSKLEMLNEYCSNESVPSSSFIHPVECDPKQNPFAIQYVRATSVPTGESILNYDIGKTFIATQGQQADGNYLGDLWITYEVELSKPVLASAVTQSPYETLVYSGNSSTSYFTTLVSDTTGLGVTATGRVLTLPAGFGNVYAINMYFDDSNLSAFTMTAPTMTNGVVNIFRFCTVVSGSSQALLFLVVTKTEANKASVLTFPAATATGSMASDTVTVAQIS